MYDFPAVSDCLIINMNKFDAVSTEILIKNYLIQHISLYRSLVMLSFAISGVTYILYFKKMSAVFIRKIKSV